MDRLGPVDDDAPSEGTELSEVGDAYDKALIEACSIATNEAYASTSQSEKRQWEQDLIESGFMQQQGEGPTALAPKLNMHYFWELDNRIDRAFNGLPEWHVDPGVAVGGGMPDHRIHLFDWNDVKSSSRIDFFRGVPADDKQNICWVEILTLLPKLEKRFKKSHGLESETSLGGVVETVVGLAFAVETDYVHLETSQLVWHNDDDKRLWQNVWDMLRHIPRIVPKAGMFYESEKTGRKASVAKRAKLVADPVEPTAPASGQPASSASGQSLGPKPPSHPPPAHLAVPQASSASGQDDERRVADLERIRANDAITMELALEEQERQHKAATDAREVAFAEEMSREFAKLHEEMATEKAKSAQIAIDNARCERQFHERKLQAAQDALKASELKMLESKVNLGRDIFDMCHKNDFGGAIAMMQGENCDIEFVSDGGRTILMTAARVANVPCVQEIMKRWPEAVNKKTHKHNSAGGYSTLHYLADAEKKMYGLDRDARPGTDNYDNAREAVTETIEAVFEKTSDEVIMSRTVHGATVLHCAAGRNNILFMGAILPRLRDRLGLNELHTFLQTPNKADLPKSCADMSWYSTKMRTLLCHYGAQPLQPKPAGLGSNGAVLRDGTKSGNANGRTRRANEQRRRSPSPSSQRSSRWQDGSWPYTSGQYASSWQANTRWSS